MDDTPLGADGTSNYPAESMANEPLPHPDNVIDFPLRHKVATPPPEAMSTALS